MAALHRRRTSCWPKSQQPKATADTMILLWMAGGMAQTETFDPKAYTPYETGLECEPGPEHLPLDRHGRGQHQALARPGRTSRKVMDRGTLIRSHRVGDLGFILHSRHQYHWHTGL